MRYILSLSSREAALENAGGKGMSLSRLIGAGFPVPGGFIITTEAYRLYVAENGIQAIITRELKSIDPTDMVAVEKASDKIKACFARGKTAEEIVSGITIAYGALNGAPVAVRSSATAEDLPEASFAGQQETYLNIQGTDDVLEAVKKCWASLWTARAIAYRAKNGIDQASAALAVVVQMLVFADSAGIMFTANPSGGNRGEVVINVAWGLGEAVVSGAVTPDTVVVSKTNLRIVRKQIAEKSVRTVRTDNGTAKVAVPADLKKKAVLSKAEALELAGLGSKIEEYYKMPMDIEWAMENGKFWIVQARPITALPPEWKVPDPKGLYNRTSLAEHIPGPVTPLFATLGLEAANRESFRFWEQVMGKTAKNVCPDRNIYKVINGYMYLGIHMSFMNSLRLIRMSLRNLPMLKRGVERWRLARKEFKDVVDGWENKSFCKFSPSELLEGAEVLFEAACRYFTAIQATLPAASVSEVLFTKFYNLMVRRREDPLATQFLLGSDTYALKAEKSLSDIAGWIGIHPALVKYFHDTNDEKLEMEIVRQRPPEGVPEDSWEGLQSRLGRHFDEFGKTAYEFDFAYPVPKENPKPVLDAIKACLIGKTGNPYMRQKEALEKRDGARAAILSRIGWPRRKWFERLLKWAQDTGPMREDSIYDMGMAHPLIRGMLSELGRRFTAAGAIMESGDIYWLEKSEVLELVAALERGKTLPQMAERIPARKKLREDNLKAVPPVMLPEKSRLSIFVPGRNSEKKDGRTVLKGIGTSGGSVTAPACVLFGPEDFKNLRQGDVLVAVTTTPAWTPLFSLASAVVTDIGGPLSHSSIVAREYGIPAVMATRTATRAIRSGQSVTVDGKDGTVTFE